MFLCQFQFFTTYFQFCQGFGLNSSEYHGHSFSFPQPTLRHLKYDAVSITVRFVTLHSQGPQIIANVLQVLLFSVDSNSRSEYYLEIFSGVPVMESLPSRLASSDHEPPLARKEVQDPLPGLGETVNDGLLEVRDVVTPEAGGVAVSHHLGRQLGVQVVTAGEEVRHQEVGGGLPQFARLLPAVFPVEGHELDMFAVPLQGFHVHRGVLQAGPHEDDEGFQAGLLVEGLDGPGEGEDLGGTPVSRGVNHRQLEPLQVGGQRQGGDQLGVFQVLGLPFHQVDLQYSSYSGDQLTDILPWPGQGRGNPALVEEKSLESWSWPGS